VDIILGGNPPTKEESEEVKSLGGLHVIGTERHDARRIDNQLRGRSGRQGDPGTTQFFVSLEDDLMRIFGGDRIKGLMTALNIPDDEPIQAKMVSGAIESAQSKIEGFNFDARKHLLEYDDVMNKQREIVYKKRKEFLLADNLKDKIVEIAQKLQTEENNLVEKLEAKEKEIGTENMRQIEKFVCLKVLDILWQGHLSYMEHIKDSVRLRAYAGRDPLVEYKSEGKRAFLQLLDAMDADIIDNILKAGIAKPSNQKQQQPRQTIVENKQEPGRNDPCPCGSGLKYKKCHGKGK
jgi:preprotein translocase subunit SecA